MPNRVGGATIRSVEEFQSWERLVRAGLEHESGKVETGFPSRQAQRVCAEIMLNQRDQITMRFLVIAS
jgi:hypothetical protein